MQVTEGTIGRIFVLRLEDGDVLPDVIEAFAAEKEIRVAHVALVAGIGSGEVVVGPRSGEARPIEAMRLPVNGEHEMSAVGVIAPDAEGKPILHVHGALGRSGATLTGCLRPGVKTWLVGEAVVYEIIGAEACRVADPGAGLSLLTVGKALKEKPAASAPSPAPAPAPAKTPAPAPAPAASKDHSSVIYLFNAEVN